MIIFVGEDQEKKKDLAGPPEPMNPKDSNLRGNSSRKEQENHKQKDTSPSWDSDASRDLQELGLLHLFSNPLRKWPFGLSSEEDS